MNHYEYFIVIQLLLADGTTRIVNSNICRSKPIVNFDEVMDIEFELRNTYPNKGVTILSWQSYENPE